MELESYLYPWKVVWPAVSRLLSARCKLRGCKRELVGVTGPEVHFNHCDINLYVFCAQVEEHLKAVHDQGGKKASKKRKQAFEWRCRLVNKDFLMKSLKSLD